MYFMLNVPKLNGPILLTQMCQKITKIKSKHIRCFRRNTVMTEILNCISFAVNNCSFSVEKYLNLMYYDEAEKQISPNTFKFRITWTQF